MVSPVIMAKEHKDLPDSYGLKVFYIDGKTEELELASHAYDSSTGVMEAWLTDNVVTWIPFKTGTVKRFEFDKRFTKILEIKNETK
mgnify:CR=1 FL=1|jgi:hypothetical protein